MKNFLDTSVLVATFYGDHEHHNPSFALFVRQEKKNACTAAHCLAEVYSVLTGMPGKDRAGPDEAMLFLGNVSERLTIISLDAQEYFKTIEAASLNGIMGGGIYDAIIGQCALKAKANIIYSWNVKHFKRIGPDFSARVQTP